MVKYIFLIIFKCRHPIFLDIATFSEISQQIGYVRAKVIKSSFSLLISTTVEPTAIKSFKELKFKGIYLHAKFFKIFHYNFLEDFGL